MEHIDISVIITVYNCENTIGKCLDSVLSRQSVNLEIIIIDDGSRDNTVKIIKSYLNLFSNIKLFEQKNMGSYVARNLGLNKAIGKYITFLDGDDYIDSDMYSQLINENDFDMIITDYIKEDENGNLLTQEPDIFKVEGRVSNKQKENIIERILQPKNNIIGSIWRCIYSREFLEKNKIVFFDKVYRGADLVFNINCLLKVENLIYKKVRKYHYIFYPSSISNNISIKNWMDFKKIDNELRRIVSSDYINLIDERYMGIAIWYISSLYKSKDFKGMKEIVDDIKLNKIYFSLNENFYEKVMSKLINIGNYQLIYIFNLIIQLLRKLNNYRKEKI